ncbi:MAG: hypothetical protein ABI855_10050, partial [Bacteroidota bacterium]
RKKQSRKKTTVKTNTVSVSRFKNLQHFLLQLLMLGRIIDLLFSDKWRSLKDSLPGFKAACDQLKLKFDALNQKYNDYRRIIKTVAEAKTIAKQALSESGYRLMSSCRSYAVKNGLTQLAEKMDVNLSDLLGMKYIDLIALMVNASSEIEPLIPVPDFNITEEAYNELQTKIADAQSLQNGPKSAIQQRTSIGSQLLTDMKSTMQFFNNQLIPLASNFCGNNAFWSDFVIAKHIGNTDNRHCRLFAHCQDELGNDIYGITVTVDTFTDPNTGKTYRSASAITNPVGDAEVSTFFPGFRTVTLSGPNIVTTTFPAQIFERGREVVQSYTVRPSFQNIPAPQESKQKVKSN